MRVVLPLRSAPDKLYLPLSPRVTSQFGACVGATEGVRMLRSQHADPADSPEVIRFLFAQALRLSHDLSIVLDLEGRVSFANPAVSKILGLRPEEVVGRFLWELVADPDVIGESLTSTYEYGQWQGTLTMSSRSGDPVPLRFRTVLVQTKEGQVVGVVGMGWDDSARQRIETQLVEIEQQRLIGQLASGVAHDFNNNLMIILGHAQSVMQETGLSEPARRSLELIVQAARNAGDLARRLQPGGGEADAKPQPVNLTELILGSVDKTRPRWEKETQRDGRPVRLMTELEARAPVLVRSAELDEVLTNMIFNSVDAMPEGGSLVIRTWEDETWVYTAVSDTGTGMDEATRERVGEMFFTTKGDGGHGIGLATSYEVVRQMGGRIDLDSELGVGSTFTIALPRCEEAAEPVTDHVPPPERRDATPAGHRILVIEDDDGIRDLVEVALGRYRVVTSPNGEAGLEQFFAGDFDLVLLDMSLPGKSGSQVAAAIKAERPDTPIVLMSGWTENIDLNKDHFHSVINKPFLIDELIEAISGALA